MMKSFSFFMIVSLLPLLVDGQHTPLDMHGITLTGLDGKRANFSLPEKRIALIITLGVDCPISQKYIPVIKALINNYGSEISMIAIFPSYFSLEEVTVFKKEYAFNLACYVDQDMELIKRLHARVTPEVFLIDKDSRLQYSGAIDDWFYDLGRYRRKVTRHYLKDAIDYLLNDKKIEKPTTTAIGCPIQLAESGNPSDHLHH